MILERKIASRKLKRTCEKCRVHFKKGNIYYRIRNVHREYDDLLDKNIIYTYEYLICSKCKYKEEEHNKRFFEFKKYCLHPKKFRNTVYDYIPGECVMQPDYDICELCNQVY